MAEEGPLLRLARELERNNTRPIHCLEPLQDYLDVVFHDRSFIKPIEDVVEASHELLTDMKAALVAKPEGGDENNKPRSTVVPSLAAVIKFLRVLGVERELRAPLIHLLAALTDANEGRGNPIFRPADKNPDDARAGIFSRKQMVAASELVATWKRARKCSVGAAIAGVADALDLETETLKEFRKNLGRGRVRPEVLEARAEFRAIVDEIDRKRDRTHSNSEERHLKLMLGIARDLN